MKLVEYTYQSQAYQDPKELIHAVFQSTGRPLGWPMTADEMSALGITVTEYDPVDRMTAKEKLAEAKRERADAVARIVVTVDGMSFDGDEESQSRMARTVASAAALGADLSAVKRTWVLADNSIAEVTCAQLAEALMLAGEIQTRAWVKPYESA